MHYPGENELTYTIGGWAMEVADRLRGRYTADHVAACGWRGTAIVLKEVIELRPHERDDEVPDDEVIRRDGLGFTLDEHLDGRPPSRFTYGDNTWQVRGRPGLKTGCRRLPELSPTPLEVVVQYMREDERARMSVSPPPPTKPLKDVYMKDVYRMCIDFPSSEAMVTTLRAMQNGGLVPAGAGLRLKDGLDDMGRGIVRIRDHIVRENDGYGRTHDGWVVPPLDSD